MEFIKIVWLCIGAAILYGILHDQVTARVCVEYFTIGHPPVFQTESPTLLALGWGVIATWWVGPSSRPFLNSDGEGAGSGGGCIPKRWYCVIPAPFCYPYRYIQRPTQERGSVGRLVC